jgi:hypothetical protein
MCAHDFPFRRCPRIIHTSGGSDEVEAIGRMPAHEGSPRLAHEPHQDADEHNDGDHIDDGVNHVPSIAEWDKLVTP